MGSQHVPQGQRRSRACGSHALAAASGGEVSDEEPDPGESQCAPLLTHSAKAMNLKTGTLDSQILNLPGAQKSATFVP